MKKGVYITIISIALITILLILSGCGKEKDDSSVLKKKAAEKSKEISEKKAEEKLESSKKKASQELVNFKCTIENAHSIYFLKGKASVKTDYSESWLLEDGYYSKIEMQDGIYLIKNPADESEMSFEDMMSAYRTSKTIPNMDCTLGIVKESDVTLPNYPIITPEEHGQKIIEELGLGMQ